MCERESIIKPAKTLQDRTRAWGGRLRNDRAKKSKHKIIIKNYPHFAWNACFARPPRIGRGRRSFACCGRMKGWPTEGRRGGGTVGYTVACTLHSILMVFFSTRPVNEFTIAHRSPAIVGFASCGLCDPAYGLQGMQCEGSGGMPPVCRLAKGADVVHHR